MSLNVSLNNVRVFNISLIMGQSLNILCFSNNYLKFDVISELCSLILFLQLKMEDGDEIDAMLHQSGGDEINFQQKDMHAKAL